MWKTIVNGIGAAVLAVVGLGLANIATPAWAAEQCQISTCVTMTAKPSASGWAVHFTVRMKNVGNDYEFFKLRVLGNGEMEIDAPGNHVELDLQVPAGWDGTSMAKACKDDRPLGVNCDAWATFGTELPVAAADRNFCNSYASTAVSTATAAQKQSCGLGPATGRWSTDNASHLNWCLYQFQNAGGVANKLVAARNAANSEEASRNSGLQTCQSNAAAANKAYADQRKLETQVTGKSAAECATSNVLCENRVRGIYPLTAITSAIASECTPYLQMCMANAATALAAANKAYADQRKLETQVTGKSPAECATSNVLCENRVRGIYPLTAINSAIASECTPYLQMCMTNAAIATSKVPPAAPGPVPGGGGTSGGFQFQIPLPGGNGNVVITTPGAVGNVANRAAATPTDIYDQPGGAGRKIGTLFPSDGPKPAQCRPDQWCKIPAGWVWGGHLKL